jgi:putative ABC transport system ATP-binding protein
VPTFPRSPRQLLRHALGSHRRDLAAASVLFSTHQLGESLVPVIVGATIGHAVAGGGWHALLRWLVLLAADFAFLSLSYRFGARASARARQYAAHRTRMWLAERVLRPTGSTGLPPGDLLSRASSDADRVGAFAGQVASTIAAVVVLVTSTALLLRLSLALGAIILLGTVVQLVAQRQVSRLLHRRSITEQEHQADAAVLAEDLVRGLRVLRGIGAQHTAASSYAVASDRAATAALHATSAQAALGAVGALLAGGYLTLIGAVGGWLALRGHLGLGPLVSALGLATFVIGPMSTVSGSAATYARALASARRVHEVLALGTEDDAAGAAAPPPAGPGVLEIDAVTPYAGSPLTLRAEPGGLTGLACLDPTAAAAVPQLLAALAPAAALAAERAGSGIRLDGVPLELLPTAVLRRRLLVCLHDAVLLPGTIAENLRALTGDETAVAAAAHAAFVDQVVEVTPAGAATDVGDRGETLSGGQRQRVALGRALAADPPVLVLHDPTTAVDAVTEDGIAERVRALRAGRTTLVITTSPAWLARCDRVVLWGPGGCVSADHAALVTQETDYREAVAR